MEESDITQPVIDKCKQITEYWRMEIYEGCWVISQRKEWKNVSDIEMKADITDDSIVLIDNVSKVQIPSLTIPIPSISDCLEKLRELNYKYGIEYDHDGHWIHIHGGKEEWYSANFDHQDAHIALLSALLEVLRK